MKAIIMEQTLELMFNSIDEVNNFMVENNYLYKRTQEGVGYLIKQE